ncbi:MAG: RNA 2',3'-cyclic phosphodiesterase [Candidatus Micrarchaeota archaeon]|nr:RNA 2',3'-cyclic phosphodiesterase [Candidatus Micrarchaeota archaeon]
MRLFVAVVAPQEAHAKIEKAALPLQGALGVKVLPPDNWHLTLKFLGEVPDGKVKEIEAALATVRFSPFTVSLSGAGAYPNENFPRAIWVGGKSEGAEELAKKVEEALAPLGLPADDKKFSVHLTVARSKSAGDIYDFLQKTRKVCEWEARSFTLMRSALLPQGAKYEALKEYAAQGEI